MNRSGKYTLRLDLAPLIVMTVHDNLSIDDINGLFASWQEILARKQRFAAIADVRAAHGMPSAKERAHIADWTKRIEPMSIQYSLGTANVVSSSLVRGAMTAIDWLHKPKVPQMHFSNMVEACAWCIDRLREGGLTPSPGITAYQAGLLHEGAPRKGVG
jgi:hypothetical protein